MGRGEQFNASFYDVKVLLGKIKNEENLKKIPFHQLIFPLYCISLGF